MVFWLSVASMLSSIGALGLIWGFQLLGKAVNLVGLGDELRTLLEQILTD